MSVGAMRVVRAEEADWQTWSDGRTTRGGAKWARRTWMTPVDDGKEEEMV